MVNIISVNTAKVWKKMRDEINWKLLILQPLSDGANKIDLMPHRRFLSSAEFFAIAKCKKHGLSHNAGIKGTGSK